MSNKLGRHLYKHGQYSGYTEYRYSENAAAHTNQPPIFNDARRSYLASRVSEILEEWKSSPFEYEGPVLHELRRSLCLAGHSWAQANAEAATITGMAIDHLGLRRPTWEEGQRDHPNGTDYCSWCSGPIDEADRSRGQRFCSTICAKTAIQQRERVSAAYVGVVLRSAERLIARKKAPPRECLRCGTMFYSDRETATYCSPKCSTRDFYGDRLLPDITCEGCGKEAKPAHRNSRFCSLSCRSAVVATEKRERLATVVRQCEECGSDFNPSSERSRFCSARCGSRERNRRYQARGGAPASISYTCRCCGIGFVSQKPRAPFCSKSCKDLVERFETGQRKRLTHRIFDYMIHRDRIPMTSLAVTDRLFEAA